MEDARCEELGDVFNLDLKPFVMLIQSRHGFARKLKAHENS